MRTINLRWTLLATALLASLLILTGCGPRLEPVVIAKCDPPPSLKQAPPESPESIQAAFQSWLASQGAVSP